MIKFNFLQGNWTIKKYLNTSIFAKGNLLLKKTRDFYEFRESINTNLNKEFINGFQIYKIFENKDNIIIFFNLGINKNKIYQKFNKKNMKSSYFFCKKDLYISSLKILSKNFFIIHTKIKGPKKNYNILSKYFRTI